MFLTLEVQEEKLGNIIIMFSFIFFAKSFTSLVCIHLQVEQLKDYKIIIC